jgi:hypothetical protein
MLRRVSFSEVSKLDLIPQAIISRPLSYFKEKFMVEIVQGKDDLDVFEGAAMVVDDRLPFALKHYPGYPDNTTTIYLTHELTDIQEITRIIRMIVRELGLPKEAVSWQRSDNPEL